MQPFVLDPADEVARASAIGAVICEEVSVGRTRLFHKGHRISESDLGAIATVERPIHVVRLDPNDLHEDEVGIELAGLLAGPGVTITDPKLSRVNLTASWRGLLRVDGPRLTRINRLPGLAAFSLMDRVAVSAGTVLAGAKAIPVAVDLSLLAAAAEIAAGDPIVQVKPFAPLKVGVISTEVLAGRARERFESTVRTKIDWYGGSVLGFVDLADDIDAVSTGILDWIDRGAELILTGGGNAMDPLDPALNALPGIGAELVKLGAPVHPGSMFWLAYRGETPIFNLASCSMYSRATSADLVLPWIMAKERVGVADLAELGFGGLLEGKSMSFRFPPYIEEDTPRSEEDSHG